jgi:hypothetical protein
MTISIVDRVEAGDPDTADYDTGEVIGLNGSQATVCASRGEHHELG